MDIRIDIDNTDTLESDAITTDADNIVFASSSGHCSLDCGYCIIEPIAKHEPTLDYGDFAYLLEQLTGKTIFMLSGKGDFFAGYKKKVQLLARLLDHDVEVALDINGVMIHELPQLEAGKLERIRRVNLTLHYRQVLEKRALKEWIKNALILIDRKGHDNFMVGTILSQPEMHLWQESLDYYQRNVFEATGQKIVMIRDIKEPFDQAAESRLKELTETYAPMIAEVRQEDYSSVFKGQETVLCPAGKNYFRIWNDGSVQGCPYMSELKNMGNLKQRSFRPREDLFPCSDPNYCDCFTIAKFKKMELPENIEADDTGSSHIESPPASGLRSVFKRLFS